MNDIHATPAETIDALLVRSKRPNRAVPIRRTFLQQGSGSNTIPGPLAEFVTHGDETALDLWLLIRAAASGGDFDITLASEVWARALSGCRSPISRAGVSKAMGRLEARRLIARTRSGRWSKITVLREDGSSEPYAHPGDTDAADNDDPPSYFQLPYEYWDDNWCSDLALPEKAMLLVSLSLADGFYLPAERAPEWYGFSGDTAQRGLSGLVKEKILHRTRSPKKAPLAPKGYTIENRYRVLPPFDRVRRKTGKGDEE